MEHITIVGTSHISPESLKAVERAIAREEPGIVAVELDRRRLHALLSKEKPTRPGIASIRKIGVRGWLFGMIGGWIERKLGEKVGMSPGTEMLRAVELAKEHQAKVAVIDQDIEITLRKFSKQLTWKEKWHFVVDLFKGIVLRQGPKFDISKVPPQKLIEKLLKEAKQRYPTLHRVLIEERNHIMARNLAHLSHQYPEEKIVAVIGAGHEKEIKKLLKKYIKADVVN